IDAAQRADPHALLLETTAEALDQVFVVETEGIYSLRDALVRLPELVAQTQARAVCVTTFDRLFHYQDAAETADVYRQIWLLLHRAAVGRRLTVGVPAGSTQAAHAAAVGGATWVALS